MITVPTHKRQKSPFKHSKAIYIITSGQGIVTVQIHSRKKILKGLKWPLQNGHQYRISAGFTLLCCKIQWKGVFAGVGWRCPNYTLGEFYLISPPESLEHLHLTVWSSHNISRPYSLFLFPNPSHKTKNGTTNRWETTTSNPPGPIKIFSQSTAHVMQSTWTNQTI